MGRRGVHVTATRNRRLLEDTVNLRTLLARELDLARLDVVNDTRCFPEFVVSEGSRASMEERRTHEEPGIGMTCSPRD